MPRHALARKFDQNQAVPFTDVIDLDAPFVDLAPMNDDLLISRPRAVEIVTTASIGTGPSRRLFNLIRMALLPFASWRGARVSS
jgi:hypothetical protein